MILGGVFFVLSRQSQPRITRQSFIRSTRSTVFIPEHRFYPISRRFDVGCASTSPRSDVSRTDISRRFDVGCASTSPRSDVSRTDIRRPPDRHPASPGPTSGVAPGPPDIGSFRHHPMTWAPAHGARAPGRSAGARADSSEQVERAVSAESDG
jgi:hypothetical protein